MRVQSQEYQVDLTGENDNWVWNGVLVGMLNSWLLQNWSPQLSKNCTKI